MMRKIGKKNLLEEWLKKYVVLVSSSDFNAKPEISVGVLQWNNVSGSPGYYLKNESGEKIQIVQKYVAGMKRMDDVRIIFMDSSPTYNKIGRVG